MQLKTGKLLSPLAAGSSADKFASGNSLNNGIGDQRAGPDALLDRLYRSAGEATLPYSAHVFTVFVPSLRGCWSY